MLLDADTVKKAAAQPTQGAQLAAAQERVRSLEELVDVHQNAQLEAVRRETQLLEVMPDLGKLARAYERIRKLEAVIEGLQDLRHETAEREARIFGGLQRNGSGGSLPASTRPARAWWKVWDRRDG